MHLAASTNGHSCLEFLLSKAKEHPNILCNNQDRSTPLHFAVLSDHVDNLRILMKYGANPNLADSIGNTPLHYAVSNQSLSMVRVLNEYGADGNIRNEDDICPIDICLTEDFKDIKLYF